VVATPVFVDIIRVGEVYLGAGKACPSGQHDVTVFEEEQAHDGHTYE
jgi:hypothetical protein